jgi:hypothetical protein
MRLLIIALLSTTSAAHAQDPPGSRFSGTAGLRAAAATASADGRFAMQSELRPARPDRGNGRFVLDAKLAPDLLAPSTTTACAAAGMTIFSNGFEN